MMEVATSRGYPEGTTLVVLGLVRGPKEEPVLRFTFSETARIWEEAAEVSQADDTTGDGRYDTFVVPTWQGRDDVGGRDLYTVARTPLGKVVSWNSEAAILTLDTGTEDDLTGEEVMLVDRNSFGYARMRHAGKQWVLVLDATHEEDNRRMQELLVNIHLRVVRGVLDKLVGTHGTEKTLAEITDADILGAIGRLVVEDLITLDSYIAREAENIERERRRGRFTPSKVEGEAPQW